MSSNPFKPLEPKEAPKATVTKYDNDSDKFIITYEEEEYLEKVGEKDTDFIVKTRIVEVSRIDRQKFLDEQAQDMGILNILEKVRSSGDQTLFNQTHRVSMPGVEKDALGREVEDVVDVTRYQNGTVDSLEAYKKGVEAYKNLDPSLKGKKNMESVAKMSDKDIDAYIQAKVDAIIAARSTTAEKGESK